MTALVMNKKRKPPGGKWIDVLEVVPPFDDGHDPYALPDDWQPIAELDGEQVPLRGLREQLYAQDAQGVIVTTTEKLDECMRSPGNEYVRLKPWANDYGDGYGEGYLR